MLIKDWDIRKACINDLNYFHQAVEEIYNKKIDIHIFNEQFKKKVSNRNSFLYVIETAIGNLLGFIVCDKAESLISNKPTLHITEFYISPKYRKMNLADELFLDMYDKASKMGFDKIEVLCNLTSTTTQNYYVRKKFSPTKKLYIKYI
jgi:ribosomal protein S18 acetylase RimI-like enzyme